MSRADFGTLKYYGNPKLQKRAPFVPSKPQGLDFKLDQRSPF